MPEHHLNILIETKTDYYTVQTDLLTYFNSTIAELEIIYFHNFRKFLAILQKIKYRGFSNNPMIFFILTILGGPRKRDLLKSSHGFPDYNYLLYNIFCTFIWSNKMCLSICLSVCLSLCLKKVVECYSCLNEILFVGDCEFHKKNGLVVKQWISNDSAGTERTYHWWERTIGRAWSAPIG